MTATTSRTNGPTPLMVTSIVLLVAGLVVGFLGVRAAVGSYEREQGLKEYSSVYHRAEFVAEVGSRADRAARKLCSCDDERVSLFRETEDAFLRMDVDRYNALVARQNRLATRVNALAVELGSLVQSLDQA